MKILQCAGKPLCFYLPSKYLAAYINFLTDDNVKLVKHIDKLYNYNITAYGIHIKENLPRQMETEGNS